MKHEHRVFLAIGTVSAPEYLERRLAMRASWMQSPDTGSGKLRTMSRFVVRSEHAPLALAHQLREEQQRFADVLEVAVPWNETRFRGPVLALAAWILYAAPIAQWIAKTDDDVYLDIRNLEGLLRMLPAQQPILLGHITWFHWEAQTFFPVGTGWTFMQSFHAGARCRNATRVSYACVGPFPFASGFLAVMSSPLAASIARPNGIIEKDVARLEALKPPPRLDGKPRTMVLEDIWLGSTIYRELPAKPLTYVSLTADKLAVDSWGVRTSRQAIVTHVRAKRFERYLMLHAFHSNSSRATQYRLSCGNHTGCSAFKAAAGSAFCEGTQLDARMCSAFCNRTSSSCHKDEELAWEHGGDAPFLQSKAHFLEDNRRLLALSDVAFPTQHKSVPNIPHIVRTKHTTT